MDSIDKREKSRGVGIESLLTLIFIALKLTGQIDWSWIWVLSPFWLPVVFFAAAVAFILLGGRLVKGKW